MSLSERRTSRPETSSVVVVFELMPHGQDDDVISVLDLEQGHIA
jgi:hypothetical protein